MPRRWQVIRVELLRGRDIVCDPAPGRVLICPPPTTFAQLGRAIDLAFARWDLGHLRSYELADGTKVVDGELAHDLVASPRGVIPRVMGLAEHVNRHARVGDSFTYIFDLGDEWTHRCRVEGVGDPLDSYGDVPEQPVSIWGWGTIPDQYGRAWDGDDGESDPPPPREDPWGLHARDAGAGPSSPLVEMSLVRSALARGAVDDLLAAITGVDLQPALQQVGAALHAAYGSVSGAKRAAVTPFIFAVYYRATERDWPGDALLAAQLLSDLRELSAGGRPVPVDLDALASTMDGLGGDFEGAHLNIVTGEVVSRVLTDSAYGGDAEVDVDGDEWVHLPKPRGDYDDLVAFAQAHHDPAVRDRLLAATQGRGAFSRFRRVVDDLGVQAHWQVFRDDRRWGRLREVLDELGLRPQ